MSSEIEFKWCCNNPKRYVVRFPGEPIVKFCEIHFVEENIRGAILIHDLKLKKNVELPLINLEIKGTSDPRTGLSQQLPSSRSRGFDD